MAKTIIYTKTGCPYCRRITEEYRTRGVPFEEINLSVDLDARHMVKKKYRADRVPVIVRDGKLVQIGDHNGMG
jgi:glutaredoxin 3